jgi:arginyl-tRNA synthetase
MSISQEIQKSLQKAIKQLHIDAESGQILVAECSVPTFGDYTCNIAMQLFENADKSQWNSPRSLAQAIADVIHIDGVTMNVAGAGFINFTLSDELLSRQLRETLDQSSIVKTNAGKKAIVEYSSPNIAKPFTIGHLRSTIIGDSVAHLLEHTGYTVYRDNHMGDWGTQFGKLIVAIKRWGNVETIETASNPVKELVALYVKFHDEAEEDASLEDEAREWFTKLENNDHEARDLWQKCIDLSWKEFDHIYQELGVTFTENEGRGYGESYFEDKMSQIVTILEKSGYLQEGKEGAKLFFFPDDELPPLMILKKDGSTLYATRDLATDFFRLHSPRYGNDVLIINEVGAEQELYFRQIFRIEELLGWVQPGQRVHVKHGLYRFKEGKMSTRKGNVVWLEDVITEAKQRAQALQKTENEANGGQTASQVAIGAIKWNDLKRSSHLDVTFDWDEILSMDGNSGPYMQYTVVRARSVLAKAQESLQTSVSAGQLTGQYNAQERLIIRQLLYLENTLERASNEYSPHLLCTYLYTLASLFNSFYNTHRILDENEDREKRLGLTRAVADVIETGMKTLGIQIPSKM